MKKLLLISACVAALGMSQVANALQITPSTGTDGSTRWQGNQTGNNQILDYIQAPVADGGLGINLGTEQYKADVGTALAPATVETGPLSGSYTTVFSNEPLDPADATVTYNGGNYVGPTAYALVKDGNQIPAWYLFNLSALGWNGTDTLEFTAFWPGQGAISHVALYGASTPPGTGVPDGGATAVLLGLGMLGLGFMARRKA